MQDNPDYQRGLEAARADAKQGWTHCWLPAHQLAEQAVYSAFGLSPEELGYAAGLDEAFPGGLGELSGFLDAVRPAGTLRHAPGATPQESDQPAGPVDTLATVVLTIGCTAERVPGGQGRQLGNGFVIYRQPAYSEKSGQKKLFLARFMYLYTHNLSR